MGLGAQGHMFGGEEAQGAQELRWLAPEEQNRVACPAPGPRVQPRRSGHSSAGMEAREGEPRPLGEHSPRQMQGPSLGDGAGARGSHKDTAAPQFPAAGLGARDAETLALWAWSVP